MGRPARNTDDADERLEVVAGEAAENSRLLKQAAEMNQELVLSGIRQLELTEAAEGLNALLQTEMAARKQTQQALLVSERLASAARLSASIAHEINNPLEAVMNTLYLARTTAGLPDSARQYLETAEGELNRDSSAPTTFSVAALLDGVIDLLQAKVKSSGVAVERQCDAHLQVTGNLGELRQVLSNLLANSLDAVKENGTVKLRASLDRHRRTRITVADNGRGIKAAALPHIFEPFFTTKGSIGTGLGLWVSKELVEKHGGSIRVRSSTSGPHQGTAFSFVLPAQSIKDAAA